MKTNDKRNSRVKPILVRPDDEENEIIKKKMREYNLKPRKIINIALRKLEGGEVKIVTVE